MSASIGRTVRWNPATTVAVVLGILLVISRTVSWVSGRDFLYDAPGWGSMEFTIETLGRILFAPGFAVADRVTGDSHAGALVEVVLATSTMLPIAIALDWTLRRFFRRSSQAN